MVGRMRLSSGRQREDLGEKAQRFCDHALLRPRAQQSPAVGHWHCWAQGLSQEAAQIKGKMWGKTSLQSSLCYMAGMGLSAVARSRKQW